MQRPMPLNIAHRFVSAYRTIDRSRGFTLPEVLLAGVLMAMIAYASSTIYFSALNINNETIWRLPPYDSATFAVQRVTDERNRVRTKGQSDRRGRLMWYADMHIGLRL